MQTRNMTRRKQKLIKKGFLLKCQQDVINGGDALPPPVYTMGCLLSRDVLFYFLSEVPVTNGVQDLQIQNWLHVGVLDRQC